MVFRTCHPLLLHGMLSHQLFDPKLSASPFTPSPVRLIFSCLFGLVMQRTLDPMGSLDKLSKILYRASRLSRDIKAVKQGPDAIVKRIVRKSVYRSGNRVIAALLRSLLK